MADSIRERLDAYAAETDFERGDLLEDREHEAPEAFAALRAVLDRVARMDTRGEAHDDRLMRVVAYVIRADIAKALHVEVPS